MDRFWWTRWRSRDVLCDTTFSTRNTHCQIQFCNKHRLPDIEIYPEKHRSLHFASHDDKYVHETEETDMSYFTVAILRDFSLWLVKGQKNNPMFGTPLDTALWHSVCRADSLNRQCSWLVLKRCLVHVPIMTLIFLVSLLSPSWRLPGYSPEIGHTSSFHILYKIIIKYLSFHSYSLSYWKLR